MKPFCHVYEAALFQYKTGKRKRGGEEQHA